MSQPAKRRAEPLPLVMRSQNGCENASSSQLGKSFGEIVAVQRLSGQHRRQRAPVEEQAGVDEPLEEPLAPGGVDAGRALERGVAVGTCQPADDFLVERRLLVPELDDAIGETQAHDVRANGGFFIDATNAERTV